MELAGNCCVQTANGNEQICTFVPAVKGKLQRLDFVFLRNKLERGEQQWQLIYRRTVTSEGAMFNFSLQD